MANLRSAAKNLRFEMKIGVFDEELKKFLVDNGMDKVLVFRGYFESLPPTPGAGDEALALARHAGAGDRL